MTPLRKLREKRGLTALAVSSEIGVDQSYYSKLETMKAIASPAMARKIARFFGNAVTEHQILYPTDYMDQEPVNG